MRTDAELVTACLNGEKDAFAVLVRRYERPARAAALNVCRDYHCAADICQDAFVRAYEKLPRLRKPGSFGPWLMKITRRCALDSVHRNPKEAQLERATAAAIENPDGQLDADKQILLAAVMKLSESQKQVIMLRYFAGHTVKDVAKIAGRSVGTVTKQLSRAHKRLRNILERS